MFLNIVKNNRVKLFYGVCLIATSTTFNASASEKELIQVDRYTSVQLGPTMNESDPLSVAVSIDFPPNVLTVNDAIRYTLRNSGWSFVSFPEDEALNLTIKSRLPKIHRNMGLMSIRDVLNVLVGPAYTSVEDPIRRLVSFDLKKEYEGLVAHDG